MAQADAANSTSRRHFLSFLGAAAATAAGAVAVAAPPAEDAMGTHTVRTSSGDPEAPSADWNALYDELRELFEVYQGHKALRDERHDAFTRWAKRNPPPSDLDRLVQRDYQERYETALAQCEFGALKAAEDKAFSDYYEAVKRTARTPVKNLADARGKAACSLIDNDTGPIHRLLLKELRAIHLHDIHSVSA